MIDDLDETIKQLLTAELPIKNGDIAVAFDQPAREWSARLQKPTVNLFLYDVRENNVLRQHQWQEIANERVNGRQSAARKRTPFRIDCTYVLTTWAAEPEDEHRLLARCLLTLFRHPILTETLLVGELRGQPFEVQARLAAHDRLTNPAELWSALDNEIRPSVSYVVTLALDPWSEIKGPIVRNLTLRTGQARRLPHRQLQPGTAVDIVTIGGTIRSQNQPQSGLTVALKDTGFVDTTDEVGHFRLGGLVPGDYTLIAWPGGKRRPVERKVTVPAGDYDIDL